MGVSNIGGLTGSLRRGKLREEVRDGVHRIKEYPSPNWSEEICEWMRRVEFGRSGSEGSKGPSKEIYPLFESIYFFRSKEKVPQEG